MIFQFQTVNVTFFDEDQAYFEEKLGTLTKFLGNEAGDEDSTQMHIKMEKSAHHHKGDIFSASAHMTSPHGGDFHAEIDADTIKKCADLLEDILAKQVKKFHEKHIG